MSEHRRSGRKDPSFSIYEFSSWLNKQPKPELHFPKLREGNHKVVSEHIVDASVPKKIESRLGLERLEEQVMKHNSTLDRATAVGLAKSFKENGGVVSGELEDMTVSVKTEVGCFKLPKLYTKPAKSP
jgi:hypothetical protein